MSSSWSVSMWSEVNAMGTTPLSGVRVWRALPVLRRSLARATFAGPPVTARQLSRDLKSRVSYSQHRQWRQLHGDTDHLAQRPIMATNEPNREWQPCGDLLREFGPVRLRYSANASIKPSCSGQRSITDHVELGFWPDCWYNRAMWFKLDSRRTTVLFLDVSKSQEKFKPVLRILIEAIMCSGLSSSISSIAVLGQDCRISKTWIFKNTVKFKSFQNLQKYFKVFKSLSNSLKKGKIKFKNYQYKICAAPSPDSEYRVAWPFPRPVFSSTSNRTLPPISS